MNATPATSDRRLLFGSALAVIGLLWLLAGLAFLPGGEGWGYDYRAYADAAERLAESGSLYQAETLDGPYRPGPYGLYMYAPPLGLAIGPLASIELDTAIVIWFLLHGLALAAACALMPVERWIKLAAFGVAALSLAVLRDFALGNVSVLLLLPLAAAWRWLDRPAGAIAQALAMAVRPTLGAAARVAAAATPVACRGLDHRRRTRAHRADACHSWASRATATTSPSCATLAASRAWPRTMTSAPACWSSASTEPSPTLALLVGYGLGIAAIALSLRRDRELGFVVTASASLLLSPLLWDHYFAMLVLPAAFLAARGRTWGLVLPLLTWLPGPLLPFVALAGVWLPFLAPDRKPGPRGQAEEPDSRLAAA